MNSSQIRSMFLDFFEQRGHLVLPSYPLIPKDDPTLLLIGAGMAPFKPYFSGEVKPPRTRIATCQKCVRTPDIDRVGKTGRHATFFEMLGNFSFGDYFKVEAITWAWELVTEVYRLPRERLWVSVYEEDDEAFQIWQKRVGLPAERIIRLGKEDNFWEIGVGPCGPCSEIYYDLGPAVGCGQPGCAVGCDCDRFLEIWNLVFTQFSREPSGQLVPLKQKNIDTGAGLERLAMALQGVSSLYEIDLVQPIYNYIKSICGEAVAKDRQTALRIATEHSRGIVFLVADGVLPANEGRGYVLRRLLRRAVRFGRLLGIEGPFLSGVVPLIARSMGDAYPELLEKQEMIKQVISIEENRFLETLSQGMDILEQYIDSMRQEQNDVLPGKWAFKLYDTYGFPLDLTREILSERGLRVDEDSFHQCLADQQERARSARAKSGESGRDHRYRLAEEVNPRFAGYETLVTNTRVALILSGGTAVAEAQAGETVELFLECTPFYAEAGGQVGDTGTISLRQGRVQVESVFYTPAGQIVHRGTVLAGTVRKGDQVKAAVDGERRQALRRSHTATHLLHQALKEQLGSHVNQAGSLVEADRLRFDFTHYAALQRSALEQLEERLNNLVLQNLPVSVLETSLEEARKMNAAALFTEKYADKVRVVSIGDYSRELCGGTHVRGTAEIGQYRIVSEEGIGSGLRRIEAVTGMEAFRLAVADRQRLDQLSGELNAPGEQLPGKFKDLLAEHRRLQKQHQELKQQLAGYTVGDLLANLKQVYGINVLSAQVTADSMDTLLMLSDEIKKQLPSVVLVLGAVCNGKAMLVSAVTRDLVKKGLQANNIIKQIAKIIGGGGGGKPELAQAGGKKTDALPEALESVIDVVRQLAAADMYKADSSTGRQKK